ncbi:MAG: single-stranded-DNA-specific exonuclease RecJ [Butyricicoccaceae bacterium]
MKAKQWSIAKPDRECIRQLIEQGYPGLVAFVLSARGLKQPEEAREFLRTDLDGLHDPMLLPDMPKAVELIEQSIRDGERIAVFGDYDVDGVTSTCTLIRYLRSRGADCLYYIPDRLSEGYGLNEQAMHTLAERGVQLMITVDSGITAIEEIALARSLGMKVVVTDHHECKEILPDANAVVNPKRPDSQYPFSNLAGVGVAFKLICALEGPTRLLQTVNRYIDLVAVGTIADVMTLNGENRVIVAHGLEVLQHTQNVGLRMLMREAGVENRRMTSGIVSFTLAPRINAAGRIDCASNAAELFLTDDVSRAQDIAALLCRQNRERQDAENEILQQAYETLKTEYHPDEDKMIVLWGEDWHHGVIGIVSSRITDRYGCPAILISLDGDKGKGSGRSVGSFNLFEALEHNSQYLEKFGGHALAAGLTVSREQLVPFKQAICDYAREHIREEDLISELKIDCEILPQWITMESVRSLSVLEPYGMGNPQPMFCIREMRVEEMIPISSDKHLKIILSKDGILFTAMLFGTGSNGCAAVVGSIVDAAFHLDINTFRGRNTVQLMLKDLRLSECEREKDRQLWRSYSRFMDGGEIGAEEVDRLYPDRPDLVAVWRHIISRASDNQLSVPFLGLSRRIEWETKRDINIGKLFVCLDVFAESQLINYHYKNDQVNIFLKPYQGKADISRSVVLATLRGMKQR